jgi:ABC-type sugar transport system ATPase subunit
MAEQILQFEEISKSFFGIRALRNVSLSMERGRILGLVGENGAGKTTLMNILGGVLPPDQGRILIEGEAYAPAGPADAIDRGVGFIHQELNLFTNLTVSENIFIGGFPRFKLIPMIDRRRMNRDAEPLLQSINLNISPNTKVETLSPGERQLVEIVKALAADAQIIIFDEPTTSLTAKETRKLFDIIRQLKAEGKSIIYISHILDDVVDLVDDVAVLRDGQLMATGPKDDFPIHKMISLMVGREIENMYPEKTSTPQKEAVLTVEGISQPGIVRDINFSLHKGEILGLFGLMGSGRSELARIVFGVDPCKSGRVVMNGEPLSPGDPRERIAKGIAFVTENRREEGLLMDSSIAENIGLVSLPEFVTAFAKIVRQGQLYERAGEVSETLRIKSGDITSAPAKSLSGGNQQKAVIAKWLLANPHALILDEPTRGIDVGAKYEVFSIVNRLAKEGTGVLAISSELDELEAMCDRIIVMSRGETTGEFHRSEFDKESILAAAFRQSEVIQTA